MTRAALLVGGVLIALIATELALRAGAFGSESGGLRGLHAARPDRSWLYGLRAGAQLSTGEPVAVDYEINADGFRDRVRSVEKPPGTFRILVLGDSLAFGYGVGQSAAFPAVLEERANARSDVAVEVLNFGVGGYNPYNEAELFADVGVRYRPDLVLVQFCINDLNDPTSHFDASTQLALPDLPDAAFPEPETRLETPAVSAWQSACATSRLCDLLTSRLADSQHAAVDWKRTFASRDTDADDVVWAWLGDRYAQIAADAERIDAQMGIVVFPYPAQFDSDDETRLQQRMRRLTAERGWREIDLYSALSAAAPVSELFFDLWHPTVLGHRIAAEQIARSLACSGHYSTPLQCEDPRP